MGLNYYYTKDVVVFFDGLYKYFKGWDIEVKKDRMTPDRYSVYCIRPEVVPT